MILTIIIINKFLENLRQNISYHKNPHILAVLFQILISNSMANFNHNIKFVDFLLRSGRKSDLSIGKILSYKAVFETPSG